MVGIVVVQNSQSDGSCSRCRGCAAEKHLRCVGPTSTSTPPRSRYAGRYGSWRSKVNRVRLQEGQTKSGKARVIDLDETTLAALKAHRASVASVSLMLARDDALVLGTLAGDYMHPDRFSRRFNETLQAAPRELGADTLPTIRLHDLRHTHATLLLQTGIHPKIVSERLGHAKISITLDVYSHAMPTMQRDAATKLGALVYGASS